MTAETLQEVSYSRQSIGNCFLSTPDMAKDSFLDQKITIGLVNRAHSLSNYEIIDENSLREGVLSASCFAIPRVGDKVLGFYDGNQYWIIAILASFGTCNLTIQGSDVEVDAKNFSLSAKEINTSSAEWNASHHSISIFSLDFIANIASMEWIGKKISAWIDLVLCNSRRTIRNVSEIETIQCGTYDLQVKESAVLSSGNTVITAQNLIKIDGEQVHVG